MAVHFFFARKRNGTADRGVFARDPNAGVDSCVAQQISFFLCCCSINTFVLLQRNYIPAQARAHLLQSISCKISLTSAWPILFCCQGITAYDAVDGLIPLTNPTISSSNSQVSVSMAKPLPCTGDLYTVRGACFSPATSLLGGVVQSISSIGCAELHQQHKLFWEEGKQQVHMRSATPALIRRRARHM
jgi:hypothetical protein